jgi:superfamily II DNA/RNA helicase
VCSSDLLNKYTKYDVSQVKKEEKDPHIGQITVITPGKCKTLHKFKKIKFDSLKMVVVDEADHFFGNEADRDITTNLISHIDKNTPDVQKLFFSATYNEVVTAAIKKIIPENSLTIRIQNKLLTLKGVKQMYHVTTDSKPKFDVIEDLFNEFDNTQMIVFVNTKKYAEMAHRHLTKKGYKASIITGNVDPVERDQIMEKFRKRELQFIFATNVLSRGIDISDMKLMINLDIPTVTDNDGFMNGDYENYLHRIGRTGRFDTKGLALTIIDGKEERKEKEMECLKQIQEYYGSNIEELKSIEDLPDIYKEHCEQ